MKTMEAKDLLNEMLSEIGQADQEMYPHYEPEHGEKETGVVITDPFLRQIYMLERHYQKEAKLQGVQFTYGGDKSAHIEAIRLDTKSDLLHDLFWFLVKEKYELHKEMTDGGLGLRKGWKIYKLAPKPKMPPFIQAIIGDMNGGE